MKKKKSASFAKARGGTRPFRPKATQQLANLAKTNRRKGFVTFLSPLIARYT